MTHTDPTTEQMADDPAVAEAFSITGLIQHYGQPGDDYWRCMVRDEDNKLCRTNGKRLDFTHELFAVRHLLEEHGGLAWFRAVNAMRTAHPEQFVWERLDQAIHLTEIRLDSVNDRATSIAKHLSDELIRFRDEIEQVSDVVRFHAEPTRSSDWGDLPRLIAERQTLIQELAPLTRVRDAEVPKKWEHVR